MTLATEQTEWADQHVGGTSSISGDVTRWEENEDGSVTFYLRGTTGERGEWVAFPPKTADQLAREQAEREAREAELEAERQREEDERNAEALAIQEAEDARRAEEAEAAAVERAGKIDTVIATLSLNNGAAEALRELLT